MMTDILLGTSPAEAGSDRGLRHLKRKLRREQKKLSVFVNDVVMAFGFGMKPKRIPEEVITLVRNELPEQPWVKGVHKEIAQELGLSNGTISAAIDIPILRGIFSDQVDGRLI